MSTASDSDTSRAVMPRYWVLVSTVVFLYVGVFITLINQSDDDKTKAAFAAVIVQLAEKVAALEERK